MQRDGNNSCVRIFSINDLLQFLLSFLTIDDFFRFQLVNKGFQQKNALNNFWAQAFMRHFSGYVITGSSARVPIYKAILTQASHLFKMEHDDKASIEMMSQVMQLESGEIIPWRGLFIAVEFINYARSKKAIAIRNAKDGLPFDSSLFIRDADFLIIIYNFNKNLYFRIMREFYIGIFREFECKLDPKSLARFHNFDSDEGFRIDLDNPNKADEYGMPQLMRAVQSGNIASVRLLLDAGAAPDLQDSNGMTIMDFADHNLKQYLERYMLYFTGKIKKYMLDTYVKTNRLKVYIMVIRNLFAISRTNFSSYKECFFLFQGKGLGSPLSCMQCKNSADFKAALNAEYKLISSNQGTTSSSIAAAYSQPLNDQDLVQLPKEVLGCTDKLLACLQLSSEYLSSLLKALNDYDFKVDKEKENLYKEMLYYAIITHNLEVLDYLLKNNVDTLHTYCVKLPNGHEKHISAKNLALECKNWDAFTMIKAYNDSSCAPKYSGKKHGR